MRRFLIGKISELIDSDFERLLLILYRIDVSEEKVQASLAAADLAHGPEVLADLIIERQIEKQTTREKNKKNDEADNDEERW